MARVVIREGKANDRLKQGWRGLSSERGRQTIDWNGDGEGCHQRGEGKRSTETGMARVVIREGRANDRLKRGWRGLSLERGKANDRLKRGWRGLSSEGGRQTIDWNGDGEGCYQRGEGKRSTETGMARVVIREGKANDRLKRGWQGLSSEGGRQTIDWNGDGGGCHQRGEGKRSTETEMVRVVIREGKVNDRLKRG